MKLLTLGIERGYYFDFCPLAYPVIPYEFFKSIFVTLDVFWKLYEIVKIEKEKENLSLEILTSKQTLEGVILVILLIGTVWCLLVKE